MAFTKRVALGLSINLTNAQFSGVKIKAGLPSLPSCELSVQLTISSVSSYLLNTYCVPGGNWGWVVRWKWRNQDHFQQGNLYYSTWEKSGMDEYMSSFPGYSGQEKEYKYLLKTIICKWQPSNSYWLEGEKRKYPVATVSGKFGSNGSGNPHAVFPHFPVYWTSIHKPLFTLFPKVANPDLRPTFS